MVVTDGREQPTRTLTLTARLVVIGSRAKGLAALINAELAASASDILTGAGAPVRAILGIARIAVFAARASVTLATLGYSSFVSVRPTLLAA